MQKIIKKELFIAYLYLGLMPNEKLQKICGVGDAEDYKKRIIYSLSLFWS